MQAPLVPTVVGGVAVKVQSGTTLVSASFTPDPGEIIVACVTYVTAVAATATFSDSVGLGWSANIGGSFALSRTRVGLAVAPRNPVAMTVTCTLSQATSNAILVVLRIPRGVITALVASVTGQSNSVATDVVATYAAAPPPMNLSLAVLGISDDSGAIAPTEDAAYTQIISSSQTNGTARQVLDISARLQSAATTVTWRTNAASVNAFATGAILQVQPLALGSPRVVGQAVAAGAW